MGLFDAMRSLFGSPYEVMDRAAMADLDTRAVGSLVVPPHQLNRPQWTTGSPQRYVSEGWSKAPVVYACVMAIADAVATAPLQVMLQQGDDEPQPADNTPLGALIRRPNTDMDGAEFVTVVTAIAALSGFCVVEKERNRLGDVIGLWPLRSDWLKPIPRRDSAPAWEYAIPGYRNPDILEPEDVIVHTHAPDPNRGYMGTAPMAVAFRELGIENAMTDFLKAFFDRGALPVYAIRTEKGFRNQAEADAFRERVVGKYGGSLKSAEPMLFDAISGIERIGFDFDELAYPELRALSETQICTAFGVPPIIIGVQAGLDRATYSNYEQAERSFYQKTVTAQWRRLDGALSRSLVPEFDDAGALLVDFDKGAVPALQDDENDLWARVDSAVKGGWLSTHTAQRMVGLDPHGPDVLYQPFSAVAVPATPAGQRSRATAELHEPVTRQLAAGPYERREGRTYLRFDALPDEQRQRHERAAQHNRDMIGRFADVLEPRMAAFFAEQGRRVRAAIFGERGDRHPIETRALEDWQWEEERELLRGLIEQWFDEAGAAMVAEIASQLDSGAVWAGGNPYIADLREQLGTRITGIHETTRADVERLIVDGLAEGKGLDALAGELETMFEQTYRNRAMTVARTESQWGINVATGAAYEQSGIQRAVLHDNPAHSEPYGASDGLSCAERNGLVVPVRDVPRHASAEHPNGTMAVGPIVEGA